MIPDLFQFIVLIVWMLASIGIAPIVQYWFLQFDAFNIYPFVCTKCTTFWTNLLPNVVLAYVWSPWFALWGLVTASILAVMIIYTNRKYGNQN